MYSVGQPQIEIAEKNLLFLPTASGAAATPAARLHLGVDITELQLVRCYFGKRARERILAVDLELKQMEETRLAEVEAGQDVIARPALQIDNQAGGPAPRI